MVSPAMLIVALVIAIAIILFCIIVLKLNASIGMVLASLFMGVAGGLDLMTTMDTISSGFGSMMTSIGLPVGFGTILGQLMSDSGAADIIADKLVSAFPEKRSIWGLSLAGFVLSIPVFFDVTFIILIPIGITIAAKIDMKMCYVTGCLTIGATTAHCVVPPTPNPLAAADIFGFDLGIMMIVGLVVGFITVLVSDFIYVKIHNRGIWNEEKDVNHSSNVVNELVAARAAQNDAKARPSFGMALLPVVIPVVCILFGTLGTAVFDEEPLICSFLGNKLVAMTLGTLGAYLVSLPYIGRENLEKSAGEGPEECRRGAADHRCRRLFLLCHHRYRHWQCHREPAGHRYHLRHPCHVPGLLHWHDLPCGAGLRHRGRHDLYGHHGNHRSRHRLPSRVDRAGLPVRRQLHRPCQ